MEDVRPRRFAVHHERQLHRHHGGLHCRESSLRLSFHSVHAARLTLTSSALCFALLKTTDLLGSSLAPLGGLPHPLALALQTSYPVRRLARSALRARPLLGHSDHERARSGAYRRRQSTGTHLVSLPSLSCSTLSQSALIHLSFFSSFLRKQLLGRVRRTQRALVLHPHLGHLCFDPRDRPRFPSTRQLRTTVPTHLFDAGRGEGGRRGATLLGRGG